MDDEKTTAHCAQTKVDGEATTEREQIEEALPRLRSMIEMHRARLCHKCGRSFASEEREHSEGGVDLLGRVGCVDVYGPCGHYLFSRRWRQRGAAN